jgi:dTDP-4-dehydrorhamnose reductase
VATAPELIVHCAASIPTASLSAESAAKVNKKIDTLIYKVAEQSGADIIFISSIALYENTLSPWS